MAEQKNGTNGFSRILINVSVALIVSILLGVTVTLANQAMTQAQENRSAISAIQECIRNQKETSNDIKQQLRTIESLIRNGRI